MSEAAHEQSQDNRPPSRGSGRLVIALYRLFSLTVTILAVVDAYHRRDVPLWVRFTAIFIGLIYVIAAIALTHNGRRMRILGWCMITLGLIGPLVCGLAQNHLSQFALVRNAWTPTFRLLLHSSALSGCGYRIRAGSLNLLSKLSVRD